MKICRTVEETRAAVAALKTGGKRLGFVPTMGALHDGHMSLVTLAREVTDFVAVSIFVNPTQFGEDTDLQNYPRNEARDLAMLQAAGVDVVFLPEVETIYPPGHETIVETTRLANILHGAVRPGHFRGVTSVVTRLFNIVQPDVAVFGEKDYQQLQVIKRMVADLHVPVTILGGPTRREADGLAMSSRNARLTDADRAAAVVLSKALNAAADLAQTGTSVAAIRALIEAIIASEPRASLKGLDTVTPDTLEPVEGPLTQPLAVMLSVQFSDILLIDQKVIQP
ncbi:Pantothenate synthetase [Thalassovita autumnalis]|uniref:Pantothenate synthetase n=1 Tax=Thalassovita autumnalis TaxID=2072972 RepID=A0A0P1FMN4_9RHOB|nr:pantoate--beta-alanine ligase [Thalassovita autumnalis]CUH69438.1 Pantothenate synthetase [Thalassovita autumnalis]CUH72841.1 Pantothenate synthetase [Thalassovita autumnalis]